jgi:hypothetical protein
MTYYVYVYLDTRKPGIYQYGDLTFEFEPFYVGKGSGRRATVHVSDAVNQTKASMTNPHKTNKIQAIIRETQEHPIIAKPFEGLSYNQAIQKEIDLIELIGRHHTGSGPLTNITHGGEGGCGPHTDATKDKISKALTGKPKSKKHIEALKESSASKRNKWQVTSPSGEVMVIDRLSDFCATNGLVYREMLKIAQRTEANKHIHRATKHRGWRCTKVES